MEFKQEMYFVGCRSFSSKSGKQFNIVTLLDLNSTTGEGSANEMFVDELPAICDDLQFLDKVECVLGLESMSGKPQLRSISRRIASATFNPVKS